MTPPCVGLSHGHIYHRKWSTYLIPCTLFLTAGRQHKDTLLNFWHVKQKRKRKELNISANVPLFRFLNLSFFFFFFVMQHHLNITLMAGDESWVRQAPTLIHRQLELLQVKIILSCILNRFLPNPDSLFFTCRDCHFMATYFSLQTGWWSSEWLWPSLRYSLCVQLLPKERGMAAFINSFFV